MQLRINESKFSFILRHINAIFIFVLLIYLPFSELFIHAIESYTAWSGSMVFWVSHFYEPILVILLLVNFLVFILDKKKKIEIIDYAAGLFVVWSLVSIVIHHNDLQRGVESLRFLILPFIVYLFVRFSKFENGKKISTIYLTIAGVLATIGVFEYFFLPANWVGNFLGIAGFGFGQNALESTNQASSFLAGPNQLASYLILPYFYALHRAFISKKSFITQWSNFLLLPLTLAIFLTFSRSAILGMLLGTLLILIFNIRPNRNKVGHVIVFITACATLVVSYVMYGGGTVADLMTHGASSAQHLSATENGWSSIVHSGFLNIIFGRGVGSAGPAALKFGGYISENYYLQVLIEVGFIGFIVFATFFVGAIRDFYQRSKTLFFTIVALLVNAFFLHIFSDNPAMAVSIFIVMAVVVNLENANQKPQIKTSNEAQSPNAS